MNGFRVYRNQGSPFSLVGRQRKNARQIVALGRIFFLGEVPEVAAEDTRPSTNTVIRPIAVPSAHPPNRNRCAVKTAANPLFSDENQYKERNVAGALTQRRGSQIGLPRT